MSSDPLKPLRLVILGYYGFGNLGDDLILKSFVRQISELSDNLMKNVGRAVSLTVLSSEPSQTKECLAEFVSESFTLDAQQRMSSTLVWKALCQADAFVLGGGGLFQDDTSLRSVVYYAGVVAMARLARTPVWMWGQGLTPLNTPIARCLTAWSFRQAEGIALRDAVSVSAAQQWCAASSTSVKRMMDSVWSLPLPLSTLTSQSLRQDKNMLRLGVSLREWKDLTPERIEHLATVLVSGLMHRYKEQEDMPDIQFEGWVFQQNEDEPVLTCFKNCLEKTWQDLSAELTGSEVSFQSLKPLSWVWVKGTGNLFESISQCDAVVAMRFHALVLALKARKPVLGLSYSAKVERLLAELESPVFGVHEIETLDASVFSDWLSTQPNGNRIEEMEALAGEDRDILRTWLIALAER